MVDLDTLNLMPVHTALSLAGVLLAIWLMQLASCGKLAPDDKMCIRQMRRVSMAVVAGAMLWATLYGLDRAWQPWPPFLLLSLGVDMMLGTAIVGSYWNRKEEAELQQ